MWIYNPSLLLLTVLLLHCSTWGITSTPHIRTDFLLFLLPSSSSAGQVHGPALVTHLDELPSCLQLSAAVAGETDGKCSWSQERNTEQCLCLSRFEMAFLLLWLSSLLLFGFFVLFTCRLSQTWLKLSCELSSQKLNLPLCDRFRIKSFA